MTVKLHCPDALVVQLVAEGVEPTAEPSTSGAPSIMVLVTSRAVAVQVNVDPVTCEVVGVQASVDLVRSTAARWVAIA